jgi:hypothetical protein
MPNIDSPRRSKNVGRMARLLFKITNSKIAIVQAAKRGDAILVERLLDKGAAVDSTDWNGGTALSGGAANGHVAVAVVELLVVNGKPRLGRPNRNDSGAPPWQHPPSLTPPHMIGYAG